jgi:hypothetical protein
VNKQSEIESAKLASVGFLAHVRATIADFQDFAQLRVGRNELGEPTVFAVLREEHYLEAVRDCARHYEDVWWETHGVMVTIWTIPDGRLDQPSIDCDFPWRVYE